MKVTVIVPEDYMGDVIGDLNSRRGHDPAAWMHVSGCTADQCTWFRCPRCSVTPTDLRSKTQGRGQYTMEPTATMQRFRRILREEDYERQREQEQMNKFPYLFDKLFALAS